MSTKLNNNNNNNNNNNITDDLLISEINKLYGIISSQEEKGHRTIGHQNLSIKDKKLMSNIDADSLYGEILVKGVHTISSKQCMNLYESKILYDFGMGCGKLLLIIFNLFPNITRLEGFELSKSRYLIAVNAYKQYHKLSLLEENENSIEFQILSDTSSEISSEISSDISSEISQKRTIKLWCKSFTELSNEQIISVDRLIVNVNFANPEIMKPLFN